MASVARRVFIRPRERSYSTSKDLYDEIRMELERLGRAMSMSNRPIYCLPARGCPRCLSWERVLLGVSRHKAVRARDSNPGSLGLSFE